MPGDGSSSLRRGLRALDVLAHAGGPDDPGLGVVDVARRLGVDKSQASRTLRTLAEHGLVERDPATRAYRIGPRVFTYASLVAERRLLREGPPVLVELVATLGERAHLSVLDGASVLTLLSESPPHAVQTAGWAGRTVPAYCTAAGRALLADYDAAALKALFARTPLEPRAPRTITDVDVLARRIAEAAARGWATADEELEPGLAAVAAPVRRFDGRIIAALNVSGPSFRFSARLEQAGAEVAGAAQRLSERLQKSTPGVAEVATDV